MVNWCSEKCYWRLARQSCCPRRAQTGWQKMASFLRQHTSYRMNAPKNWKMEKWFGILSHTWYKSWYNKYTYICTYIYIYIYIYIYCEQYWEYDEALFVPKKRLKSGAPALGWEPAPSESSHESRRGTRCAWRWHLPSVCIEEKNPKVLQVLEIRQKASFDCEALLLKAFVFGPIKLMVRFQFGACLFGSFWQHSFCKYSFAIMSHCCATSTWFLDHSYCFLIRLSSWQQTPCVSLSHNLFPSLLPGSWISTSNSCWPSVFSGMAAWAFRTVGSM